MAFRRPLIDPHAFWPFFWFIPPPVSLPSLKKAWRDTRGFLWSRSHFAGAGFSQTALPQSAASIRSILSFLFYKKRFKRSLRQETRDWDFWKKTWVRSWESSLRSSTASLTLISMLRATPLWILWEITSIASHRTASPIMNFWSLFSMSNLNMTLQEGLSFFRVQRACWDLSMEECRFPSSRESLGWMRRSAIPFISPLLAALSLRSYMGRRRKTGRALLKSWSCEKRLN